MNKKAIAILGAIFVLIIGTLGFLIFSKYSGTEDRADGGENTEVVTSDGNSPAPSPEPVFNPPPPASGLQFYKLTDDQVVSPALTFDGSGVAYFTKQGFLYRSSFLNDSSPLQFGDKKQLAIESKPGLSRVIWPYNSQNFMLEYASGGKKTWEYYHNKSGVFTVLPSQVYSLSFLPNAQPDTQEDRVYYVWSVPTGADTVNVADASTKNYKTLSEIWDKNAVVYVSPDGLNVVYHQDPNVISSAENPIVLTDVEGKTWRKIVATGLNSGVLWSPDGKKFLFGKKDPVSQKYQLWFYDLLGGEIRKLDFFTIVEKAVWGADSQTIYVAVPKTGSPENGGLTVDSFFRMNTSSLEKREFDPGTSQYDGRDLFLNKSDDRLFFRNAQDGGLYYFDLN